MQKVKKCEELKKQGVLANELVNILSKDKLHHSCVRFILRAVYRLDFEMIDKIVYSHSYYKPFLNEENPFNKDFINNID